MFNQLMLDLENDFYIVEVEEGDLRLRQWRAEIVVEEVPCLNRPLRSNIGLYRSGVTSPERLRHTSVAREHLLDNAIESVRGSVDRKSKNHLLFIGPRGIGKTHLLSCIEDAVRSDEALGANVSWWSGSRRNPTGRCPSPIS